MILIQKFKHVNYNLLLAMNQSFQTGLKLKNNLTCELEQFIPEKGNYVRWYTCGPTVYSHSHMGHARNYLCNDMIRRVMRDYFGYNIQYCMNITDVDDKIINNSNQKGIEYFQFARKWENDFFDDMKALGVQIPDYITRVTEYVPEIVAFIEKIIANGYAYESNKSVYFNIAEFVKKFQYGKLKRIKDAETQQEETNEKGQKRNKEDFVLWKAAKPHEPIWNSPWGEGRPGWHIECSAMACSILGQNLDIHSGGIDLIFPHHENELAQSQAYNNKPNWVKYFIHVGHLHITGLKMSKSLKNFITIKELLKITEARIIKLFFFIHRYDVILNYDPETSLKEAVQKDKRYKNFFANLQAAIRQAKTSDPLKINSEDQEFDEFIEKMKKNIYEAFCDNINTPGVISQIDEAIKKTNIYLGSKTKKITLLNKAYRDILHPLKSMGLQFLKNQSSSNETGILDAMTKFRDQIRQNAKTDFKNILDICDKFRDYDLVQLNIRLQDKKIGDPSTWKYEEKQILIKQREKKIEDKVKRQQEAKAKQQEKLLKMSKNPNTLWAGDVKFSQFDQNGIPTHEKKKEKNEIVEKPLSENFRKKLEKQWSSQNELYQKWLLINKQ